MIEIEIEITEDSDGKKHFVAHAYTGEQKTEIAIEYMNVEIQAITSGMTRYTVSAGV